MLDELASLHTAYPEAAVLRARIALEEGNRPFAIRFLDQQIRQFGDVPQLRETYARRCTWPAAGRKPRIS